MAGLRLEKVCKNFGSVEVIKGVDLEIEDGEFVVFVGPSGCGKSTLLRTISGLEDATSGRILIDGDDITDQDPSDRGVAMVFQSYALYPHMNVAKNLGFGLRMGGMPKEDVAVRVDEAARILDISSLMDRKPKALSGGQRQRVAIGRAIVRQPKVFLFDEPLSNLDAELRTQTRLEIARLHHELKTTMIFVTHDQIEAMTLADKIVVLRDGLIEQQGTPISLYDDPDNVFVAGFIGSPKMNLLDAVVTKVDGDTTRVLVKSLTDDEISITTRHKGKAKIGDNVTLGVRPEHFIDPIAGGIIFKAHIHAVERLGGVSYLYSKGRDGAELTVQEKGHSLSSMGEEKAFGVDAWSVFLFGADGERL